MADSDETLYRAFLGARRQGYYLAYFARADARGYAPISWHWPVLAFGVLWFFYRKLYLWGLAVLGAPYLASAIGAGSERVFTGSGNIIAFGLLIGLFAVWLPLEANAIYYRYARAAVAKVRLAYPAKLEAQVAMLTVQGGVHMQLPMILFGLLLLLSIFLSMTPATA